jgi:hypothetical protein
MANNRNPNQKQPGEKEPGKFHYNHGNMSGKIIGQRKDKSKKQAGADTSGAERSQKITAVASSATAYNFGTACHP